MRTVVTGLLSASLVFALVGSASAYTTKKQRVAPKSNSPSVIAERQRHARTFDETKYYEHDLSKIPLGTRAWWDQYDRERGGDRR